MAKKYNSTRPEMKNLAIPQKKRGQRDGTASMEKKAERELQERR